MSRGPLEVGERVLLIDNKERRYLVTLGEGQQFHSHSGVLEHDQLIGSEEGTLVRSSGRGTFTVFRPTLSDFVLKMKRGAQVVYPKDIGLILVYADIFPGATVVEAGTGSGSLTLALARAVGAEGHVISYELREDHHAQGAANIEAWFAAQGAKADNVELRIGDVFEGIPEQGVDRMVFDLPEPWNAIGTSTNSLASGGILCCYLPTIPQVSQTVEAMRRGGFGEIETFEGLVRTWNVDGQSVRPDHRMVAHTGFIIVGRKLS
ncbi:MAG: tRNA (adenine57-N1/adenine58-N1)-methyltransferase catalytic subunit [Actinomycetota bacterium]|nr:tRNA (adenine57-N1/adenine58-N1)-methyltransferase catalytic subunit [Actinomycetota bacterium]